MPTPLFLDCDTGIDDSLALLYLLSRSDVDLIGIASTAGNVPTDVVVANNLAWLEFCGRTTIPVHVGAQSPLTTPLRTAEDTHGPRGVGYAQLSAATTAPSSVSAAQAWCDAARDQEGDLVGLAIGPLTNLALAIRQDPDLPTRLARLVIMGGAFGVPGNTTPVAEWNIAVDPEAAAEVLTAFDRPDAPDPILCGLNITEQLSFTPERLEHLRAMAPEAPLITHLTDALRFYFEFHDAQGEGYQAFVHDPFAAMVALDPDRVTAAAARVAVELDGTHTRAMTVADLRGMTGPPNATIVTGANIGTMIDELVRSLAGLAETLKRQR